MTTPQPNTIQENLGDLVGKVLDHSQSRLPGETQMYLMYIEKATQAIKDYILKEIIGDDEVFTKQKKYLTRAEVKMVSRNLLRQAQRAKLGVEL